MSSRLSEDYRTLMRTGFVIRRGLRGRALAVWRESMRSRCRADKLRVRTYEGLPPSWDPLGWVAADLIDKPVTDEELEATARRLRDGEMR